FYNLARGKGIELMSDVSLTKEAQYKEVIKKSLRDFYKTHPSGSGTATKPTSKEESFKSETESWRNDEDESNNDQDTRSDESDQEKASDDDKTQSDNKNESDFEHETNESGSEFDQEEKEKIEDDKEEEEEEIVKTSSNDSDDEDETKVADKVKGYEDEEMDYTTSQLYDDVDIRLNEPVDSNKGFVQEEGTNVAMANKMKVPVTRSYHSSDLAAKFLNFVDIPHSDAEIISPLDVYVHHKVPSQQTPTLLTVHVSVITDSSPVFSTIISQSLPSFTPPPQQSSPTPPPTTEATNPSSTLPGFASVFQFNNRVTALEKEAAATLTEFELKKILIDKMDKSESYLAAPEHRKCYKGLKKSYDLDKTFFATYGKVYSLKRSRKDKDKDKDPSARSD
nr:hypothetical protein [Tanacetum cinerariifolium]